MIHRGDALAVLRGMPANSLQTCITSPPYWGLRDYGTAAWQGGAKDCDHAGAPMRTRAAINQNCRTGADVQFYREQCEKCGARRIDQQLGLEPTPEAYVARMVEVFREVRRVLKDDGTLWLNLGDSYATGAGKVGDSPGGGAQGERWLGRGMNTKQPKWAAALGPIAQPNRMPIAGLKPKDLVGIPWRVAFALQADGWFLRSDIIWHKPNPMPESVRDRPTKSHEYLFLLAKSAKYFYDAAAIAEASVKAGSPLHLTGGRGKRAGTRDGLRGGTWSKTRNRRTVWTVAPRPFKGAHFATFPPALVEPCVRAGSRPGDRVLDPFSGAGTTILVAEQLGRVGVGIELNPEYIAIAKARLKAAA